MASEPSTHARRDDLLEDLNEAQREAVTHGGGPLLVVAGAGTGKTRVLTRRVAWLVAGGLPSRAILAITFTNKAAQVLRQRLAALPRAADVWAGTFHSFCAWMLRSRGDAIGVDPQYTVLDRDDQRRLLRDLIKDLDADVPGIKPAPVSEMISLAKNGGAGSRPLDTSIPDVEAAFESIFAAYRKRLRASNLLDFDDLLIEGLRLLEDDAESAAWYRQRFAHVLVDEYQDTNLVQARLTHELLSPSLNLTVVGDPDQSIYRWRGAIVENILDFETVYPGTRKVVLERNYRSTGAILEAAESVIAKNVHRHAKRLFTESERGAKVVEVRCRDADDEAEAVAAQIQRWQGEGYRADAIAVFYRVNSHSRALEMALRLRKIPYVVVAGVEFFQRREVKDVLAYARLVENPDDDAAFLRIVNIPRRGVGATSLKKLRLAAMMAGTSCVETLRQGLGGLRGKAQKGALEVMALVESAQRMPRAPVGPLLEFLTERSGYRAWLEAEAEKDDLGRGRIENVDELVAYAHEFDESEPEGDLRVFLERAALVTDQDAYDEGSARVSLMSVHAAKGLEFPCVVVTGAEDGLFPHARNAEDGPGLEEERRLFYVALTRAMERLAVTHAASRRTYRGEEPRRASPFLRDIPPEVVERQDRVPGYAGGGYGGPGRSGDLFATRDRYRDADADDAIEVVREAEFPFEIGERVRHPYFGNGYLKARQGAGAEMRVTVDFEQFGRKQLLLRHAQLERAP